ncbi:MAG: oligopeptide:H+ symporter [Burkholderiales bacterium]|nr:oligopeptide:H+ symporter [Burkholderiales bacterium]
MMQSVTNLHARRFSIFFLTEMWERYGFYVIQTLLIFYLSNQLHLDDKSSYVIVGSFTALSYINCIFGGLIADKLIGSSRCILLGGVLLFIGYTVLGLSYNNITLDLGLAVISIGTGLLKPNVSGLLSSIYRDDETKKENGYTLYYVGIYVGAISGSFIGGYIHAGFGWSLAFFSSALGGLIAFVTFLYGIYKFKLIDTRHIDIKMFTYVYALICISILMVVAYLVIHSSSLGTAYFIVVGILCLVYLLTTIINHRGMQRRKLIAFTILILISVLYWGIYFQQFFSVSLCLARACKLSLPASSFSSIESLGVILCGPLIIKLWDYFKSRDKNVSIATRFSLGYLCNALGFLVICGGLWFAIKTDQYLYSAFIAIAYLMIAIGELCLSPTSLSMVSTLVPKGYNSVMTGISLLSIGFGGKLAGMLAGNSDTINTSMLANIQQGYLSLFLGYFSLSIVAFIFMFAIRKYINKLISS